MSIIATVCGLGLMLASSQQPPQLVCCSPFQVHHLLYVPPPIEFHVRVGKNQHQPEPMRMQRMRDFRGGLFEEEVLSPEYCEHVMVIAEEIDPAIAAYLKSMCSEDPEGFERVIRRQGRRLASLMHLKEVDPELYDIRLSGLKTDAEIIRVTQAMQLAGPEDPQLQANAAELRALIGARIKNATLAKEHDIVRLQQKIERLQEEIAETENQFDALVEKRFNQLFDVVQNTKPAPKEE